MRTACVAGAGVLNGALALLERWTRRPARNFTVLAVTVLALSMIPIGIEIATPATRLMLAVLHTLVLVALLPTRRTSTV